MKILLDARLYGLENAGIGRYVMNLVNYLAKIDKTNEYLALVRNKDQQKFQISNFKLQIIDISHYSIREQIELPQILNKLDFDLAHFPDFNVPLFFNRPFVVTIHDLTRLSFKGIKTTTRNPFLYWMKYTGYQVVMANTISRAEKIMVPSKKVKEDIVKTYGTREDKIEVIYEGVDEVFRKVSSVSKVPKAILGKYKVNNPYIIYTGSAYPHKNVERLIRAIKLLNEEFQLNEKITLVIASAKNVFTIRLLDYIKQQNAQQYVQVLGFVPDEDLAMLYANAKAFVFPSLSEGFGLPGLEAMAMGCPVICSDISIFHEIYADVAIYFDPYKENDIAKKIAGLLNLDKLKQQSIIRKGKERAKKFSWQKMAEDTLEIYKNIAR